MTEETAGTPSLTDKIKAEFDRLNSRIAAQAAEIERLKEDAERYRWLLPHLIVAADRPEGWTCWLALECIPYRSKASDAQTLLDELMERFPVDSAKGKS